MSVTLPSADLALLDRFQRRMPLAPRPYRIMGEAVGMSEPSVIERLARYRSAGVISRVGAVFRPHSVGRSTLAAVAAPAKDLDSVAKRVNGYAEVNHNYERDHRYNLWFVVTGEDDAAVAGVLADIESHTGLEVLNLPLVRDFHIDLGFSLTPATGSDRRRQVQLHPTKPADSPMSKGDRDLVAAIEPGLPLVERPFRELARRVRASEESVIGRLDAWLQRGTVKRLGIVVRHRELGFRSNGMVVWNIPDADVASAGHRLASYPWVTLCYQRPRRTPHWPYNLFTMVHGRDRETVREQVALMASDADLPTIPRTILFSLRRFKQRGAHYGLQHSAAATP